jgi:predicted metal-dependent phosphoesterase TrpH
MLKVELHAHTDLDPADRITHSTTDLIDRAAALGYGAIAVTLHDRYFDPAPWNAYARERGVVLLAGIERTIAHRHILLINFPPSCAAVRSFDDVRRLKAETGGLVIAPHPYYPVRSALQSLLDAHASLFDAVELNAMYTTRLDFNRRAIAWARARGTPLVGNTDLHLLDQLGTTYTMVDAPADADSICKAIRHGQIEVRTEPLTELQAGLIFGQMWLGGVLGAVRGKGAGGS